MASILVVDDDPDVLDTVATIIRSAGHRVSAAANGDDALDLLDSDFPLDLLVTDIVMPGINGLSLARLVRDRRPTIRILYISGFSDAPEVRRDIGEDRLLGKLLKKPLLPRDLRREVNEALSQRPN
jgi:two-component system cell cycle response regulator CpdR